MNKIIIILALMVLPFTVAFAQEKVIGDLSVKLGVISWEEMRVSSKEKTVPYTGKFHQKMAKAMSEMHGGNAKGSYHVMVMLSDKSTGKDMKDADIEVTAIAKAGPEKITHHLKSMSMDGFSGYGEFYKMTFQGPYVFKVTIEKNYRTYKTEFERIIQ